MLNINGVFMELEDVLILVNKTTGFVSSSFATFERSIAADIDRKEEDRLRDLRKASIKRLNAFGFLHDEKTKARAEATKKNLIDQGI